LTARSAARLEVVFILPDTPGGVFSFTSGILAQRSALTGRHVVARVVRTRALRSQAPLAADTLSADEQITFEHDLPNENLYSVMRRLNRVIAREPGVIIANDWIELATTATYDSGMAVVAVTHGDSEYYYGLATTFEQTIDAFVTVSRRGYDELCRRLPHRTGDIRHVRTGIDTDVRVREPAAGPLRVVYAGRFDEAKRVTDLPAIAQALHERGVRVAWTLFGDGALRSQVQAAWPSGVEAFFAGQTSVDTVRDALARQDVFILTSSAEGLPISLLEAGAAGVVPVVTSIPSGMGEVVEHGVTGMFCTAGDVDAFARVLTSLSMDRVLLEQMSAAVRAVVVERFDVTRSAGELMSVAERAIVRRRERGYRRTGPFTGSRLDRRWLPNALVRAVRRGGNR
jgi:glycosyltransferase involved in cell wall biosynthesis